MDSNKERKTRKPYDGLNALAVKATARHFEVTESYARMIVTGAKKATRSKEIIAFFNEKYRELQKIIN